MSFSISCKLRWVQLNPFLQRAWCQTLLLTEISTVFRGIMSLWPKWPNKFSFFHKSFNEAKKFSLYFYWGEMHEYRSNRIRWKKGGHCVLTKNVAALQPLSQCLLEGSVSHAQGTGHWSCKWQEQWNWAVCKELHEPAVVCNYKVFC